MEGFKWKNQRRDREGIQTHLLMNMLLNGLVRRGTRIVQRERNRFPRKGLQVFAGGGREARCR